MNHDAPLCTAKVLSIIGHIENLVAHLRPAGHLITGYSVVPDGCSPSLFAAWAGAAGLELVERWSTWHPDAFVEHSGYNLTVHRLRA
jgi:hypothetical protein